MYDKHEGLVMRLQNFKGYLLVENNTFEELSINFESCTKEDDIPSKKA